MCQKDVEEKRLFTEELNRVIARLIEQSERYNHTDDLNGDGVILSPISVENIGA